MRKTNLGTLILGALLASGAIYAGSGIFDIPRDEFSNTWLTYEEEKLALQQIDNICGDTWCEGDYDFGFDRLRCLKEQGVCLLEFRMIERSFSQDDREVVSETDTYQAAKNPSEKHHAVECQIAGITEFSQIVTDDRLNDEFYQTLTNCISDLESSL